MFVAVCLCACAYVNIHAFYVLLSMLTKKRFQKLLRIKNNNLLMSVFMLKFVFCTHHEPTIFIAIKKIYCACIHYYNIVYTRPSRAYIGISNPITYCVELCSGGPHNAGQHCINILKLLLYNQKT